MIFPWICAGQFLHIRLRCRLLTSVVLTRETMLFRSLLFSETVMIFLARYGVFNGSLCSVWGRFGKGFSRACLACCWSIKIIL